MSARRVTTASSLADKPHPEITGCRIRCSRHPEMQGRRKGRGASSIGVDRNSVRLAAAKAMACPLPLYASASRRKRLGATPHSCMRAANCSVSQVVSPSRVAGNLNDSSQAIIRAPASRRVSRSPWPSIGMTCLRTQSEQSASDQPLANSMYRVSPLSATRPIDSRRGSDDRPVTRYRRRY